MARSSDEARVALIISSDSVSGQKIADLLQTTPTKIILRGEPTGQRDPSSHPLHIAIFGSGIGVRDELEKHLDAILDLCELRKEVLRDLMRNCRVTIHCSYYVHDQGGWTISPSLSQKMAAVPIDFIFNIERQ